MKNLICIVCPKGCHLSVDEKNDYKVTGFGCERGKEYGVNELKNPQRVITTTVNIKSENYSRLPVKTNKAVCKNLIFNCMDEINKIKINPPVNVGDVIIKDICKTGVDVVSCKKIEN